MGLRDSDKKKALLSRESKTLEELRRQNQNGLERKLSEASPTI